MPDLSPGAILVLAGTLIYLAGIAGGLLLRPRHEDEPPYTEKEIAEEGRMRAAQTDISYRHHNREVRS